MNKIKLFILLLGFLSTSEVWSQTQYENKNIPAQLKSAVHAALAQFPELASTQIDFIFKDKMKNATMQAQPRVSSFFKNRKNRRYKIKVTRRLQAGDRLEPIENLPEHILIGWFAHELGHIVDYLERSSINLTGFGLKYITSNKFVTEAERTADGHAVTHGFADELIATKKYILNQAGFSKEYKQRIDDLYPSSREIRTMKRELESKSPVSPVTEAEPLERY